MCDLLLIITILFTNYRSELSVTGRNGVNNRSSFCGAGRRARRTITTVCDHIGKLCCA